MVKWIEAQSKDEDIVISTRFRLARNLDSYKFPHIISQEDSELLTKEIVKVFSDDDDYYDFYNVGSLGEVQKHSFVEDHLISHHLIKSQNISSFLIRDDERITIMINEEDHLRIQGLLPGLSLEEGYDLVSKVDDLLDDRLDYAFDDDYGYKTACPTNVGTGLRASIMVHLPALTATGGLNAFMETMRKIGLTVRGLYGEGTEALGFLYQISNQTTLGQTEEDIIKKLEKVSLQVISRERKTREYIYMKQKEFVENRVFRSFGMLKYSRQMNSREAMLHMSNIKLGIDLDIIKGLRSKEIVKLMIKVQPANLQLLLNKQMLKEERDIERASYIRDYFKSVEG